MACIYLGTAVVHASSGHTAVAASVVETHQARRTWTPRFFFPPPQARCCLMYKVGWGVYCAHRLLLVCSSFKNKGVVSPGENSRLAWCCSGQVYLSKLSALLGCRGEAGGGRRWRTNYTKGRKSCTRKACTYGANVTETSNFTQKGTNGAKRPPSCVFSCRSWKHTHSTAVFAMKGFTE